MDNEIKMTALDFWTTLPNSDFEIANAVARTDVMMQRAFPSPVSVSRTYTLKAKSDG